MNCSVYLRGDSVLIVDFAKAPNQLSYMIDPVYVFKDNDYEEIRDVIKNIYNAGPKTLADNDPPECSLFEKAGVKSWRAFEKGTCLWSISDLNSEFKIYGHRKNHPRGWLTDLEQSVFFPRRATIDDVCDRMIAILKAKSAELKSAYAKNSGRKT